MAVYQYYLAVVPKDGIEKIHNLIPNKIRVSVETGFFESDAKLYWQEIEKKVDGIVSKVDLIITRSNWVNDGKSYDWKTYLEFVDNDASIYLDKESLTIREFSFRADLRETNFTFLKKMIELGKENNWMFMDRNGNLMNADFDEIKNSIRNSNALKFLKDPNKFIEDIEIKNN